MASDGASTAAIQPEGSSPDDQWRRRKERLPRACTSRSSARLYAAATSAAPASADRRATSEAAAAAASKEKEEQQQCSKIMTQLVQSPPESQIPRFSLRSMWELASLLNFLNAFRPLLNIGNEFSAEELETALITPNSTLDDIHIPLLKAIPPVTRMAMGRATWVTVLCRKLKDWWHWVAEGDIPIVASHGAEVEAYKTLDPGTRVLILKALCDIRVEQEDIRSYIDNSIKHGVQLSVFRKERIGGDAHGTSYWYEDDPIIGHRLYQEIRKIETKRMKGKGMPTHPIVSCQWETVATNLDEFQEVSEKLVSSRNRTEAALGKRLKNDILPEVEKIHKRKERLLKKQHRQALLLDNYVGTDGIATGRSLRDRKPVTYTFDDFDRSINEAIKVTKRRQASPEPVVRREAFDRPEASSNGRSNDPSQVTQQVSNETVSSKSTEYDESDEGDKFGPMDCNNRRRQRPQRYSDKDFVEDVSDHDADYDSDDIVGEAVYDDEYMQSRKQRKISSSSEGDEEYRWDEDNVEDEEEEEDDSASVSEDSEELRNSKKLPSHRRGAKLRSVDELQLGLRRSKRATSTRIDYRQYQMSDSEADSPKLDKSNTSDVHTDESNNVESSDGSQDSEDEEDNQEMKDVQPFPNEAERVETVDKGQSQSFPKVSNPAEVADGARQRRFLDLNELAPCTGFEDGPSAIMKDEDTDF